MEDYPRTLAEFESRFSTEDACLNFLYGLRWPDGFICPRCGHVGGWRVGCTLIECAECSYQASVKAGTIFHRSHVPLTVWFRAIWWITSQKTGTSALGLQKILGFGSYKTAWALLHKLRRAMVRPGRDCLRGKLEIDESYVGGEKPGKRGRGATGKVLVMIATEINDEKIGRIRLRRVENASATTLEEAVKEVDQSGSVIRTDGWRGYSQISRFQYAHTVVRKDAKIGENLLPYCNRVASLLKRWLLGTHQGAVSHAHLDYYMDEFTFRFNRRTSRYRGKLFYRLLQNAVQVEPVPFSQLRKKIRDKKPRNTTYRENLT